MRELFRAGVHNQGQLHPRRTHGSSGDISGCHSLGRSAIGIWRIEATDVAKHPTEGRERASPPHPPTKNFPATDVNGAKVERLV